MQREGRLWRCNTTLCDPLDKLSGRITSRTYSYCIGHTHHVLCWATGGDAELWEILVPLCLLSLTVMAFLLLMGGEATFHEVHPYLCTCDCHTSSNHSFQPVPSENVHLLCSKEGALQ